MGNPDSTHFPVDAASLFGKLSRSLSAMGLHCHAFGGDRALALAKTAGADAIRAYGLDDGQGLCMVAVPLDVFRHDADPSGEIPAGGPDLGYRLEIASFAASNHYAAIVRTLALAARRVGITKPRVFCNSRLAEKPLAVLLGLGHIGRSSLLVTPDYGSAVLLAGLVLPQAPPADVDASLVWESSGRSLKAAMTMGELCGSCRACVDACPTGAIDEQNGLNLDRCIQYWASSPEAAPPEVAAAWGPRLYGCDECVRACPASSRGAGFPSLCLAAERRPGRLIGAKSILCATDDQLSACLRGTAMGMKRFAPDLWRKNAHLALAWLESSGGG